MTPNPRSQTPQDGAMDHESPSRIKLPVVTQTVLKPLRSSGRDFIQHRPEPQRKSEKRFVQAAGDEYWKKTADMDFVL
jgi:hypothetical protein